MRKPWQEVHITLKLIKKKKTNRTTRDKMNSSLTWILTIFVTLLVMIGVDGEVYETVRRTTNQGKCRTIKYEYKIELPGCLPKVVNMRMCGGGCDSRITDQRTECSRCYPGSVKEATTVVHCPFNTDGKATKVVKYLKIRNCNCRKIGCKQWKPEERLGFTRIKLYT